MKILVIDQLGLSVDFCMQCMNAGHEVRLYTLPKPGKQRCKIGDGVVPKVANWRPSMAWADLIFTTDNSKMLEDLEPFHKRGFPIFGANLAGAKLELNRQLGQDVFKKAGIKVMDSVEFKNYDAAIKYVLTQDDRMVSKPNGDVDKSLSYVSASKRDMLFMLNRWKTTNPQNQGFILQKFQPGIEMAVGGWFGPKGWGAPFFENFEFKKHLPGDKGVNTGEQGTLGRYTADSKLADKLLRPLTSYLLKIGYRGYFDMAAIIDDKGTPWPLEATARPGWPCFILQTATHVGDPAQWMLDTLKGACTLDVLDEIAACIVVTIPDYPFTEHTGRDCEGFPIYDCEPLATGDIHLCEVMAGEAPNDEGQMEDAFVTAGDYAFVATGTDYSVRNAVARAKRAIKKIELPNSPGWRDDIGERLEKQLPILQDLGYAKGWEY